MEKYLDTCLTPATRLALITAEDAAERVIDERVRRSNDLYYRYEHRQGQRYASAAGSPGEVHAEAYAAVAIEHYGRVSAAEGAP